MPSRPWPAPAWRPSPSARSTATASARSRHRLHLTAACADPHGDCRGRTAFYDNGHYIGHDEPSVRFISNAPGSGERRHVRRAAAGRDPRAAADRQPPREGRHPLLRADGRAVDLDRRVRSATPTPHDSRASRESDSNAPTRHEPRRRRGVRGAAVLPARLCAVRRQHQLRQHPLVLGAHDRQPRVHTRRAPATTTASSRSTSRFIQRNGVPTGPPSPQESDLAHVTPNRADAADEPRRPDRRAHVRRDDAGGGHALEASESDLTTGQIGFMIASAANGFMNTNPVTCAGTPFNFQPEYTSARGQEHHSLGRRAVHAQQPVRDRPLRAVHAVTGKADHADQRERHRHVLQRTATGRTTGRRTANSSPTTRPCYPVRRHARRHGAAEPGHRLRVFFDAIGDLDYDGTSYYRRLADVGSSRAGSRARSPRLSPPAQGRPYPADPVRDRRGGTESTCDLARAPAA